MITATIRRWATFALLISAPALTLAQTLDQVLQQHFEAVGIEQLKAKQQATITSVTANPQGESPGTTWLKRPNKVRRDVEVRGVKSTALLYDGDKAYRTVMGFGGPGGGGGSQETQEIKGDDLERIKKSSMENELGSPLYNATERGLTLTVIGKETLEDGTEVIVIKSVDKGGEARSYYLDAESYVLVQVKGVVKMTMMGQQIESEFTERFADHQVVGGVTIAMQRARSSTAMGRTFGTKTTYQKIDFDTLIDDSQFVKAK